MAVPRARLGGPFGGPSLRTRNELDLAPLLDSVGRFATTSIQNAYLRKRQQKQDEQVAREKAEAAALAEQQRQERVQMADRAYQLQLRRLNFDEQQAATKAAAEAAQPKAPVRGTPEYEAALEREAKIRARNATPRSGTSTLDRQIDQARREVPRIRPIGARERVVTDPNTGQQQLRPPLDPGAAQSFVQDSTQKATRLRSLLQQRGDLPPDTAPPPAPPPVDPMADARARHTQEIREIRARNGSMDEIKAANDRFRSALMGQPVQSAAPTLPPGMQPVDPVQSAVQWIRANPQLPNETDEAYKARYRAATGQQ